MKYAKLLKETSDIDYRNNEHGMYDEQRKAYYLTSDRGTILVSQIYGKYTTESGLTFTDDETHIFQCDENFEVSDWCEMDGSQRPGVKPEVLMLQLGYKLI